MVYWLKNINKKYENKIYSIDGELFYIYINFNFLDLHIAQLHEFKIKCIEKNALIKHFCELQKMFSCQIIVFMISTVDNLFCSRHCMIKYMILT